VVVGGASGPTINSTNLQYPISPCLPLQTLPTNPTLPRANRAEKKLGSRVAEIEKGSKAEGNRSESWSTGGGRESHTPTGHGREGGDRQVKDRIEFSGDFFGDERGTVYGKTIGSLSCGRDGGNEFELQEGRRWARNEFSGREDIINTDLVSIKGRGMQPGETIEFHSPDKEGGGVRASKPGEVGPGETIESISCGKVKKPWGI
jgi:hypothetical protein